MASLKEIKSRISSIKSTRKITSAMRMVASAKLRKAETAIANMVPYQHKMNSILVNFLSAEQENINSPYNQQREDIRRVGVIVFSSNNSLAGAFNANVIKQLTNLLESYKELGKENILIYPIGRKVEEAVVKMGYKPQGTYRQLADKPSYEEAAKVADEVMTLFAEGQIDKAEIIYHHYHTTAVQRLLEEQYLPIDLKHVQEEAETTEGDNRPKRRPDYIVEPSVDEFISSLLPTVLKLKVYTALLDSNASEHAARTMAMQVATDNANELIQDLSLQYNKSRQQAITNELLDIIGGSMK